MYLLDTDILVGWLGNSEKAVIKMNELVKKGGIAVSVLTTYEFSEASFMSDNPKKAFSAVNELLNRIQEIGLDKLICADAGKIAAFLEQNGEASGYGDVLIAATAISHNLILVTRNIKHFEKIPDLKIEEW